MHEGRKEEKIIAYVNLKRMETYKTNRGYVNRGMEREFVSSFHPFVTSTKELFGHYNSVAI
jgi:hypothetical protein